MSNYWWILICPSAALVIWAPLCVASIWGCWPYNRWPARRWLIGPVRR